MKVITERTQIRDLAGALEEEWHNPDGSWRRIAQAEPDTEKIHAAVAALDPETATVEDVHAAMGFEGWIEDLDCHECGRRVPLVIQLGEEMDMESRTARVCVECLRRAIAAAEEEQS